MYWFGGGVILVSRICWWVVVGVKEELRMIFFFSIWFENLIDLVVCYWVWEEVVEKIMSVDKDMLSFVRCVLDI